MHIAQRLCDSADEELVALLGTFETAAHREPDLVKELEAAEAEVDEGTPSPAQAAESPRQFGSPNNSRILSRVEKW